MQGSFRRRENPEQADPAGFAGPQSARTSAAKHVITVHDATECTRDSMKPPNRRWNG